jgi:WD40 repeat protein/serine/threonine protein kinase
MGFATAADLVEELRKLRLLEPAQLLEADSLQPDQGDARALVKELVHRHWLTPYQANLLFQGRGRELVLGSYIVLSRLGEGGMGQVFKARHWTLGKIVAVKVLRKDRVGNPAAVRRFEREIQVAAQVSHPNVVMGYDAEETDGALFYAMEYVEGIDLGKLVKESGPLPVAEACDYACQAARGLAACHERGLIHRDIKPSNLLLTRASAGASAEIQPPNKSKESDASRPEPNRGLIKILDLGLARLEPNGGERPIERLTMVGKVVGTPDYLAPEQARDSHRVDARADLYSLGCTLYFLLTGQTPFGAGTPTEKVFRHHMEEATPLEQLRPEAPSALAAVVRKLMAKLPEDRYQTAAEVIAALEPFTSLAPPTVAPVARNVNPATPPRVLARSEPVPQRLRPTRPLSVVPSPSGGERRSTDNRQPATDRHRAFKLWLVVGTLVGVIAVALVIGVYALAHARGGETSDQPEEQPPPRDTQPPIQRQPADTRPPLDRLDAANFPLDKLPLDRPPELVAVMGEQRRRHWGQVQCVAFSPDGRLLASGGYDSAVRVWNVATGKEEATLRGQGNAVHAVAFRDDGRLVSLSPAFNRPPEVMLWDLGTKQGQALLKGVAVWPSATALSPDGRALATAVWKQDATGRVGGVKLLDLTTGKQRATLPEQAPVRVLAWSRDGTELATASGNAIRLWDAVAVKERKILPGHERSVTHLAFAPDGATLASASFQWKDNAGTGEIKLWDIMAEKEHKSFTVTGQVSAIAFSPDGTTLAVGHGQTGEGRISLWNLPAGKEQATFTRHGGPITCLAFTADGRTLASGSADHSVRLWDLASDKELQPLGGQQGPAMAVAFSPDGTTLAASAGSWEATVRLWQMATGEERLLRVGCQGGSLTLAFAAKGATLSAWSPAGITSWDSTSGKELAKLAPPKGTRLLGVLSPNGTAIASTGGQDHAIKLWDLASNERPPPRCTLQGHKAHVAAVAFSPDGQTIASGSSDKTLLLWNVPSDARGDIAPRASLAGHNAALAALAFSPDGETLASAAHDRTVKLWDVGPGEERTTLRLTLPVSSLTFSPDSKTLAAWGYRGVLLWDAGTAQRRGGSPKNDGGLRALDFSPDGQRVATAGQDGRILVARVEDGAKIAELRLSGPVHGLAFAPDGRHLATANGNGTVYVLRLKSEPGA